MTESHQFPKSRRLLKASDFDRVFSRRRSASDHALIVYACENDVEFSRLGLVASRKFGGAVERNAWKRRVREAFRLSQHELPAGVDLVVLPRGKSTPAVADLARSLASLAVQATQRL